MAPSNDRVDRRLIACLTELVLCSRCLRHGVARRVRQVISSRHRPLSLCRACRARAASAGGSASILRFDATAAGRT